MAGSQETGRQEVPVVGSAVVDVHYESPSNGWTVEQIAPLPLESQITLRDGRVITHLVKGHPYWHVHNEDIAGVTASHADEILTVARGEKPSPRWGHNHKARG